MFKLFKLFLVLIALVSSSVFAESKDTIPTLYTVKIYYEMSPQFNDLAYVLTLPADNYFSFYKGTDLPTWTVVKGNILKGQFTHDGLLTIRVHGDSRPHQQQAKLVIRDEGNARLIWQADINYDNRKRRLTLAHVIDNKKYYKTELKTAEPTVLWVMPALK